MNLKARHTHPNHPAAEGGHRPATPPRHRVPPPRAACGGSLWCGRECVFAVLALELELIDPWL
jgi:hypothetical protein